MKRPVKEQHIWYDLDNAAKIFPAVSDDRNTNVFRLACEMKEAVDKDTLQQALDQALKHFPYFQVIMRRGLFWYYLERTNQRPLVTLESERPCNRLFTRNIKCLLFRVSYYQRRINLEVFHAVSDGSGAFEFLRSILYHYITQRHREDFPEHLPPLDNEAPPVDRSQDSFEHYYDPKNKQSPFKNQAYTIGGTLLSRNSVWIISGRMPTKQVLALAKSKGVTVTAYLTALMICSIYQELMPKRSSGKTISVTIPVDLRSHFRSGTSRNFFSVVDAGYNFAGGPVDFDQVLESVSGQLSAHLTPVMLSKRMSYTMGVQKNIFARGTPLIVKDVVLRAAYNKGESATTCALSNMGRLSMPEPFAQYIDYFSCLLNPTSHHRLKACVCSYGDTFVVNFTSCIAETKAQRYFFRHLSTNNVDVCITSNGGAADEIL